MNANVNVNVNMPDGMPLSSRAVRCRGGLWWFVVALSRLASTAWLRVAP